MLLDILISDGWVAIIGFGIVITAIVIWSSITTSKQKISELESSINDLADARFEKFKESELEGYRKVIEVNEKEIGNLRLQDWKIINEERIRKDAVNRSMGVNLGKITEHLIPFSEHFKDFDPRDTRFIGSPIDLIVFDGATEDKAEISIYFVEVKTGTSKLSAKQKKVKEAIDAKRIYWKPVNGGVFNWEA